MKLYLIRHGLTQANLQHRYCGHTDLPLCEEGIQALKQLQYVKPEAVFYTSGMLRTEQTLSLLFGDCPHRIEPNFQEVNFGIFEMGSYVELKDTPAYQEWISGNNEENIPPDGESGAAMKQRVLAAFRALWDRGEDAVLITHGGVIACIMEELFPEEGKNRYQWQPKNGEGFLVSEGGYQTIP